MLGGAIEPCPLPAHALLAKYAGTGAYTDCYALEVVGAVSHAAYVEAFYTGKIFKIERFLLRLFFSKSSTDIQAKQLAVGEIDNFSGWRVEDRNTDQLLMCDFKGRTRSWLMVVPQSRDPHPQPACISDLPSWRVGPQRPENRAWAHSSGRCSGFTSATHGCCWTVLVRAWLRPTTKM